MKTPLRLWRDEKGQVSIVATTLIYAVLVFGVTAGLVTLRDQIVQEFGDLAVALDSLDQSYSIDGGASFSDSSDLTDPDGEAPAGLDVQATPRDEGQ